MFEYMTAQEVADKWNVSLRLVQRLCKENRIDGIININHVWLIPQDAKNLLTQDGETECERKLQVGEHIVKIMEGEVVNLSMDFSFEKQLQ